MRNKYALVKKDLLDAARYWEVLYSLIGVPIASLLILVLMLNRAAGAPLLFPTHAANMYRDLAVLYALYGLDQFAASVAWPLLQLNTVYFYVITLYALVLPFVMSATSVTVEKEQGTLEPMLALPFTNSDILSAKVIASVLPSLAGSLICYGIVVISVNSKFGTTAAHYLLGIRWWLLHLALVPLYSLVAGTLGLCISVKMRSSRAAIIAALLLFLPFMCIVIPLTYGFFLFNYRFIIFSGTAGLTLFLLVHRLALFLFDREKMILRYR